MLLLWLACANDPASTDTGAITDTGPQTYEAAWAGVQAMFADHCDSCHPTTNGYDLRAQIDDYIVPGDPDASYLMDALRGVSISVMMPPYGRLPAESIAHVEQWILDGAPR